MAPWKTNKKSFEALLILYFSDLKNVMKESTLHTIDGFMGICNMKDTVDGTDYCPSMKLLYGSSKLDETKSLPAMSPSTVSRFKNKIYDLFRKYIKDNDLI